jgi:amidase
MTDDTYEAGVKHMQETSRSSIIKTLQDNDVDVVIGPADARIASIAACAGYPVATVPLGFADFNGRAFGMNLISTAGNEAKMIEVMSAWESTFPNARVPPPILVNWVDEEETLSAHI